MGLLPGIRLRTAGLRREELAQLAGVGVTWYTWLEQGRPINASVQVLNAIATTLRLDAVERAHLFPVQFAGKGQPVPGGDTVSFVSRLSAEDFGRRAARFSRTGRITPP